MDTFELEGLKFSSVTMSEAVQKIIDVVHDTESINVFTVNVDIFMRSIRDAGYMSALKTGQLIVADGMPIVWTSRIMGRPLPERVAGSDLVERLCSLGVGSGLKFFFLGAGPGIAEKAAELMGSKYGTSVVGTYSPTGEELVDQESVERIIHRINTSSANVLLVALGAPRQEQWIVTHQHRLKTRVNIGVGATIDFLADKFPRAPVWMRNLGLEWAYRLMIEPRRLWKRYLITDSRYIWYVLRLMLRRQADK